MEENLNGTPVNGHVQHNELRDNITPLNVPSVDDESEMKYGDEIEVTENPIFKIRKTTIEELNYGYIVKIGCHSFAIETPDRLITLLSKYLKDPNGTEREWFAGKLMK